jgi:hypothetical protein
MIYNASRVKMTKDEYLINMKNETSTHVIIYIIFLFIYNLHYIILYYLNFL